ncbi:substrate-binding domain-containing protein [Paraglaciecola aquimarina]|uniref:Substrate-binding domain-containing protein n=1 Tax=Paraglaciecola aquimarina TaxID=1235557 RepID=A0ABU3STX3_9ALTE|nr:substrate-binding domain-containing protein [Paraglaciecola aquimarina]MDU0353461.1 substrate-binding domain-containing protein [Paraglaciecola aquimarina]
MFLFKRYLFTLLLTGMFTSSTVAQDKVSEVKVIVNSSVMTVDLSDTQIRRIFSMRQTVWADKQPITVIVLSNEHKTHQLFSTKILGVFPYQLERIWNKLVYSGLGDAPIRVSSEAQMLALISQRPGAIGYVMTELNRDDVKIVNIVRELD